MPLETPKEAVEACNDRFDRIEELLRRSSRVIGQVESLEHQIAHVEEKLSTETQDALKMFCENIRSDLTTLQETASQFLYFESDHKALCSMVSIFTSDLSDVEEYHPEGDFGRDLEPFATKFDEVCDILEREIELIQAVTLLEIDVGEPSIENIDTTDMSTDSLLPIIEEMQSERQSVSEEMEANNEIKRFNLTETDFFK